MPSWLSKSACRVFVNRIAIAGDELPLPEPDVVETVPLRLSSSQNNLSIGFVAPHDGGDVGIRYRYRLDGADAGWSRPTDQRAVTYARLAPGSCRFSVQALGDDGVEATRPVTVAFTIARPVWQRWWFLLVSALLVGGVVHAVYRARLRQLVALERVRTRLATDLHDDIASDLSMIAMAAEMARGQAPAGATGLGERLGLIAQTSRDLLDAMSDIVWAVNPARDRLEELV